VTLDFDRIALALEAADLADSLHPCERWLVDQLPASCRRVLDVGCGQGAMSRLVASHVASVLCLDQSPAMIHLARRRSAAVRNIEYRRADIVSAPLPHATFDAIISVNTLHHVPLDAVIPRLVAALRPGGLLAIQDILDRPGLRYLPINSVAWVTRRARWFTGDRDVTANRAVAALYREHGRGERYLTPRNAKHAYIELLPGARVVFHLEWRYSVIWRRPATPS
jgi:SAM-dependent methyltransferase